MAFALLLAPAGAAAQAPAPADAPPWLTGRAHLEWIAAVRGLAPAETALNPGNRTFRVPDLVLVTEVRPDLRLDAGNRLRLVVRPRWRGTSEHVWPDGLPHDERTEGEATLTEAFLAWQPRDWLSVTYGLQNFQWGPAELLSPSNRLFHEVGLFRDPLYYVRGRHLARVNLSAGRQWSLVALAELGDNGEPAFREGEHFGRAGQVKLEYAAAAGGRYVGVTAGARAGEPPWVGEYGELGIGEAWALYADAVHQRGSQAWYPVATAPFRAAFDRPHRGDEGLRTLAVAGVRYSFAGGTEVRGEYVHQDAGWSEEAFDLGALAVASEATPQAVNRWLTPGLELTGRRFVLASVRTRELPPARRLSLQGRYLRSLTDGSGVAFVTGSFDASDAVVVFASGSLTHGDEFAEFTRLARATIVAGFVRSW
jgi:hypothetical protein